MMVSPDAGSFRSCGLLRTFEPRDEVGAPILAAVRCQSHHRSI
jgi:hypothetical protein